MVGEFPLPPEEVERIADRIIAEYDRVAFEGLSSILDEVRRQNKIVATPEEESGTPPRA